jgi:molecular chaperone DnaK (HSP70)
MGWQEDKFQSTNARETRRVLVTPSAVMLELGGSWHTLIKKAAKLPCTASREFRTAANQSTVPLRLFVGNTPDQRDMLTNIGFMGITGFDPLSATSFELTISIDDNGIMTMTAADPAGQRLSIGPQHKKVVTRKIFDPTYKTGR